MNTGLSANGGIQSSFMKILTPSATTWSSPKGPTRFGPYRSCHKASSRRSSQMSPAAVVSATMRIPADASQNPGVLIIGSGFAGIGMAIRLKQAGIHSFTIFERASEIGGTWRDNTYPGCACDIPSHLYSFSFAPNPDWSMSFSPQPEIQAYIRQDALPFYPMRDIELVVAGEAPAGQPPSRRRYSRSSRRLKPDAGFPIAFP